MAYIDFSKFKNMKSSDLSSAITDTEKGKEILRRQAEELKKCIINRIKTDVYDEYSPVKYDRTYSFLNSLEINDNIQINISNNTLFIDILFSSDNAYHDSLFGGSDGYLPNLLNNGYSVKKDVWFKNIPYFGYRDGAHFIENGISDWESGNTEGVKVIEIYRKYK